MSVSVETPVTGPTGSRSARSRVAHHFTVDVEEYFQVSAMESVVRRDQWDDFESRVTQPTTEIVDMLNERGDRGTFFILGWIAERFPDLVRKIASGGHEVASHGWDHRRITTLTPEEFRDSVRRSKQLLEDIAGAPVLGFRAPSFSIVPGREWALDILIEEGYTYDSSLFPIRRPGGYGFAGTKREPHWLERPAGRLAEVPPATLTRFGANLPAAGGAYLRLLPYSLVQTAFREFDRRKVPATFYIHPWELDPEQPRLSVSTLTRVRHYGGLHRTANRIRRLLNEFHFCPIAETVAEL